MADLAYVWRTAYPAYLVALILLVSLLTGHVLGLLWDVVDLRVASFIDDYAIVPTVNGAKVIEVAR